jgi:CheY-like chemotaxis protein
MGEIIRLAEHARETQSAGMAVLRGAITMVASGAATRMLLANLPDVDTLLPQAMAMGQRLGVAVRADRSRGGLAVLVSRDGAGPHPLGDPAAEVDTVDGSILLVEDDATLAELLEHHLRAHGYAVTFASTAEEAQELLAGGERPALVLLDLNLPGDTGWSMLRQGALSLPNHPPVVLMTALEVGPRKLAEFDVAGLLPKPFPMETLIATVERFTGDAGPHPTAMTDG